MSLEKIKRIRYLTIGKKEYDLVEVISINEDALSDEFIEHPKTVAFWHRLRSRELAHLRAKEEEHETTKQFRFKQYWELYEAENKSFSDSLIWSEVFNDEAVSKLRKEVRIAKSKYEAIRDVCDALEHRKSSLINLGALQRRDEELSIRRNQGG